MTIDGTNSTFNLPVVVLQRPQPLLEAILGFLSTFKYLVSAIIVVGVIIMLYEYRRKRRPQEYNEDRARKLMQIRDQIKRER